MWNPFKTLVPKKFLGVDIGTSHIKIVEISKSGHGKKLENYGQLSGSAFYEKPFRTLEKNTLFLSNQDIVKVIKAITEEAGIKTKQVVFSIPDFSSLFTNFELPPMTKEELPQAIRYEARQHIPLPLAEVTLDWQIIESKPLDEKKTSFKILLVAVPNEVVNQYQEIARVSHLELFALEAEAFSLVRSLVAEDEKKPIALIDIGARSTTCSIIDKRILKTSHSFDISGNDLTSTLTKGLNISFSEAEKLKKQYGLEGLNDTGLGREGQTVREILLPLIDLILREIKEILNNFYQQERKEVEKVIIAGSTALLPGLKEYFQQSLDNKEVKIGNPFSNIFYPPILEKTLMEMGPSFAIAIGSALRGLEH